MEKIERRYIPNLDIDEKATVGLLENYIRKEVNNQGAKGVILGLSGGLIQQF